MKRTATTRTRSRCFALLSTLTLVSFAGAADAQETEVRVSIEQLTWGGCGDFLGPPQIYWNVTIDGVTEGNRADAIESNFSPISITPPVVFSRVVDLSNQTIDIVIEQKDRDGFGSDDDVCDISPDGKDLNLTFDLAACAFTGDVDGVCATSVFTTNGFKFSITYDAPTPSAPDTNVSCLHEPIWAQPGEEVTISATALDSALEPKEVDSIEFWIEDTDAPAETFSDATSASASFTPQGDEFSYGCRVIDGSDEVFTGWRTSEIGFPEAGEPLAAVLYTGPSTGRIDFAFFADEDDYTGSGSPPTFGDNPDFIADVGDLVRDAYYKDLFYLQAQNRVNFWIGIDGGDAEEYDAVLLECPLVAPEAPLADARVVVHLDEFRDCASARRFSVEAPRVPAARDPLLTVLHESGHRPFGLADEYCCDGGYFELPELPNLYREEQTCEDDAPNLGRPAANCRDFTSDRDDSVWHLSDPTGDDLMEGSGDQTPQGSDLRRMNWLLEKCTTGDC